MSLQQELESISKQATERIPEPARNIMQNHIKVLSESGILDKCLKVGDKMPDFELLDIEGTAVVLSELLARGPVVVSFFRGGW